MDWRSRVRQLRYPKEFRIAPSALTADTRTQLREIADLLGRQHKGQDGPSPRLVSDLGTGLWRLRLKMIQPDTGRPLEEMKRAYRHFESVWDALSEEGVKIYDHTGEIFDLGRSLQVMSFQPTVGLTRDMIIETIKPTIYFKDNLVQTGEVIVGTPEGLPSEQ